MFLYMYLLDFLPNGKAPTKAEKKNPLLTDAAQTMLMMGYLPKVIKIAVDRVLLEKGREQINQYRFDYKQNEYLQLGFVWHLKYPSIMAIA